MVIDANLYWFPEEMFEDQSLLDSFFENAQQRCGMTGVLRVDPETGIREISLENPPGQANLNYRQGDYRVERQLADLDAAGVDHAVLKIPGAQEWLPLDLCRRFNDGMAQASRLSGGRLVPLACVPPSGDPDCLAELRRCVDDLGFTGVQLSAHYGSDYLDAPRFTPFLAEVERLGLTAYVHHTPIPVDHASLVDFTNLRRSYGRCADQTTAIGRELFGGLFDRHPGLTLVHSMLGGGFFALANLLFPAPAANDSHGRFESASAVRRQFTEHVYFEMSHAEPWGAAQLECAVRVFGADHVVFGTSYPVNPRWLAGGPDFIRSLALSEADKNLILGGNAARLYRLPVADVRAASGPVEAA
ncbi:MAG: amidohydrolase family protein [Propionicimonas sp.]|uniref:amidohydrolase family protein n=1 Tax=Propionicimonas sp. TaxID=1955623 RepID=UPI003D0CF4DE